MAFKDKAMKYVKKQGKRALVAAKKRYVKKGGLNISQITKDVQMLKRLVNVEKRRVETTLLTQTSFSGGSADFFAAQITPIISQGIAQGGRIGNKLKLISACLDLQIKGNLNCVNQFRYKWYVVCKPDSTATTTTASSATNNMFEVNTFTGNVDYHSNRDAEFFKNYRIIAKGKGSLQQDQISGATAINQIKVPLKLSHHLTYNADANVNTTTNNFYLMILGDSGTAAALDGGLVLYNVRWWYVDN